MKTIFFETIKVLDGILFNLPLHHERMARTINEFYQGVDIPDLGNIDVPHEYSRGLFKCKITYSSQIENIEYIQYKKKPIRTLGIVEEPEITYPWKACDRSDLSRLLSLSGFDEIIIARDGFVTDTSFSNLVFENRNGLFTPASFLLNGTKRQELLLKRVIQAKNIRVEDLYHYDRLFLINAMLDLYDGHCFTIHPQLGNYPLFVAGKV